MKSVEKGNAINSIGPISASYWKAHDAGYVISYIGGEGNKEKKENQDDENPLSKKSSLPLSHPSSVRSMMANE